jgi:hypothetical protein
MRQHFGENEFEINWVGAGLEQSEGAAQRIVDTLIG